MRRLALLSGVLNCSERLYLYKVGFIWVVGIGSIAELYLPGPLSRTFCLVSVFPSTLVDGIQGCKLCIEGVGWGIFCACGVVK